MKTIYVLSMIVGAVLLFAIESETVVYNIFGLCAFAYSAYKLGLFNGEETKESKPIKN